jgi:hypothetical protein
MLRRAQLLSPCRVNDLKRLNCNAKVTKLPILHPFLTLIIDFACVSKCKDAKFKQINEMCKICNVTGVFLR